MKNQLRIALFLISVSSPLLQAQTVFNEVEPNGPKTEAMAIVGLTAGDTIVGGAIGNSTMPGNSTIDSADTFDLTTAAQPAGGWYRYTLTITGGNSMSVRGLTTTASIGAGGTPVPGSDREMQVDTTIAGNSLRWYANEDPSRLFVRVTGVMNSPMQYTMTLFVDAVTTTLAPFTAGAGDLTIDTRNLGHSTDTELAIADSNRELIPFWQNGSQIGLGTQAGLTRNFAAGTYYILISDWSMKHEFGPAADTGGVLNGAMDFPNAILNTNINSIANLTFSVDDGGASFVQPTTKPGIYGIAIIELNVGVSSVNGFCFGDGGSTLGCTPCPCANNVPVGTASGCLNSNGQGASLVTSGVAQVSNDTLHFEVTGANANTFGLLVSAPNQLPQMGSCPPGSGIAPPNFDGLRCVGGGLIRHGSRGFDVNGDTTSGWGPPNAPMAGLAAQNGFLSGQTRNFQVFYRENPAFVCGTGQNSTNGVSITWLQ